MSTKNKIVSIVDDEINITELFQGRNIMFEIPFMGQLPYLFWIQNSGITTQYSPG